MNDLIQIINDNYGIIAENIELISDHPGSKVYLATSQTGKYALKKTGLNNHGEKDGELSEFLSRNGINVAKFLRTKTNGFAFFDEHFQYTLQEFIDGEQIPLNTASDWFMIKTAQTLGQIQNVLRDYKQLNKAQWPSWLLSKDPITQNEPAIIAKIEEVKNSGDTALAAALQQRLKHIRRISGFNIELDKLTHVNSHGDFYINQTILKGKDLYVIDWDGGSNLPACNEVMMSFVYADPVCKDGIIDIDRFKPYLNEYLKYTELTSYDIQMMPYFTYSYFCFCGFTPPYDDLSDDYMQIAIFSDTLMNWLHDNVDTLSAELVAIFQD